MRKVKSEYAQTFNSNCKQWENNREFNLVYLKAQQHYFNDVLKSRGYVFLRDIYECLGFPVTKTSLFVGWYYDLDNPFGDNCVDFNLPRTNKGKNANITIDFNIDGDITNRFKD